jgi:hypothetical protein
MLVTSRDEKYVDQIQKLIGKKIESRTLEGLAEATQARPPREDRGGRSGARGKPRGRNDRDRKQHSYPVKPHGQVASMEPTPAAPQPVEAAPAPAATVQSQAQPAPRNAHRQDHRQRSQQPKQQHAPKPQKSHHNDEDTRDTRSQLPAFLLRPVKLPPAVEKPAPRAKKKDTAES